MSYPKAMRHALAVLVLLSGPVLAAEPIVGRASVTDGDTVVIRSTRVRLHGIDAPESAQLCQDAAGKSLPVRASGGARPGSPDRRGDYLL